MMAKLSPGQKRAKFTMMARAAIKAKLSASKFLRVASSQGFSFRRTDMLAEWRNLKKVDRVADALQFVRKDRMPTAAVIAQVDWALSREYMYKVKVYSRTRPGEDVTERFVNIMQDRPRTPGEIEALAWELIQKQSPKLQAQIVGVKAWTVLQRVIV